MFKGRAGTREEDKRRCQGGYPVGRVEMMSTTGEERRHKRKRRKWGRDPDREYVLWVRLSTFFDGNCWSLVWCFASGLSQGKYERKEKRGMRMGVILDGQWTRKGAGRKESEKKEEKREKTKDENIKSSGLC